MPEITLSMPADLASVGERWQALQEKADASFFQTWNWWAASRKSGFPNRC